MIMTRYLGFETVEEVSDKDQLPETGKDRRWLRSYIAFFQRQGVEDMTEDEFEWGHLVSVGPNLLIVSKMNIAFLKGGLRTHFSKT